MKSIWARLALLLIGGASVGLLSHLAAQAPKKIPPEQRIVLVAGNDPWTETDILIRPQDKVTFKASGKVCFLLSTPQSCVGPSGWPLQDYPTSWPDQWGDCEDPISDANHASLIGSIGEGIFYIGPGMTIEDQQGGLKLGINDCSFDGPNGNSGEFSVVVSIVRGKG
jgi:hypothetical protein